jgi:phage gp16-like protein
MTAAARRHQADGYRAAALKAVFAACRAQCIDDDARRDIVRQITGKSSLKDCTSAEMGRVLDRLNKRSGGRRQGTGSLPFTGRAGVGMGSGRDGDGVSETRSPNPADEWRFVFRAAQSRQPYLKKIYRLAEAIGQMQTPPVKVMPKHYIEGIARQMLGGLDTRLEFCDEVMLVKIVAALDIHKRRQGAA